MLVNTVNVELMAGERFWTVGSARTAASGQLNVVKEVEQLLVLRGQRCSQGVDGEIGGVVD
jgi:hypothetical protein